MISISLFVVLTLIKSSLSVLDVELEFFDSLIIAKDVALNSTQATTLISTSECKLRKEI